MININTSSLSPYTSVYPAAVKIKEDTDSSAAKADETTTVAVDVSGATAEKAGSSGSISEQMIEQLKEQIEQVEKQLAAEQQQLAAAQSSKGSEQEKAQRIMAIQQQIAGTTSQLMSLQGALLALMKGSVNTTA